MGRFFYWLLRMISEMTEPNNIVEFLKYFIPATITACGVGVPIVVANINARRDEKIARANRHAEMDAKLESLASVINNNRLAVEKEAEYGKGLYHRLDAISNSILQTGRAIEKLEQENELIIRDIARLTMYSDNLSLEDQLDAGKRYTDAGGNGPGHVRYDVLKERYAEQMREKERS